MNKNTYKTTWDGKPIADEKVIGASVIVYRRDEERIEFLILHRSQCDPYGDWSWTPPSGARQPEESLESCAIRELNEEAGLNLKVKATEFGSDTWKVFKAETDFQAEIKLIDDEHDDFKWVEIDEAKELCRPEIVFGPMGEVFDQIRGSV